MPNITLIRSHLFEAIGRQYTDKEFDELCFEFGVEVDDVESQIIEVDRVSQTKKITCLSVHRQWNERGAYRLCDCYSCEPL
jgi:hypothetical protein